MKINTKAIDLHKQPYPERETLYGTLTLSEEEGRILRNSKGKMIWSTICSNVRRLHFYMKYTYK